MFTGIIETVGNVISSAGDTLRLDLGAISEGVKVGDSISIDGVCLTVRTIAGSTADFDVSAETLRVTTLGALSSASKVNLERSLRVGDRLGGHFVLGHVDAVGRIRSLQKSAGQVDLRVAAAPEILRRLVLKGSIAVDGISLTISGLDSSTFAVVVIPHTFENTTLHLKSPGQPVNIELDIIGKYVENLAATRLGAPPGNLTEGFLSEHGFR